MILQSIFPSVFRIVCNFFSEKVEIKKLLKNNRKLSTNILENLDYEFKLQSTDYLLSVECFFSMRKRQLRLNNFIKTSDIVRKLWQS